MINKLRLGHTRVTHGYIFDHESGFERQPMCPWCGVELFSIRHILMDCEVLQKVRNDILETALRGRDVTVRSLIGEGGVVGNAIVYLREIGIYCEISIQNRLLTLCWGGHYYMHWPLSGR